jgi:hypothetical protein
MIEDKLLRDERIRLEALAQANMSAKLRADEHRAENIIERAKVFEAYIRGDELEKLDEQTWG